MEQQTVWATAPS